MIFNPLPPLKNKCITFDLYVIHCLDSHGREVVKTLQYRLLVLIKVTDLCSNYANCANYAISTGANLHDFMRTETWRITGVYIRKSKDSDWFNPNRALQTEMVIMGTSSLGTKSRLNVSVVYGEKKYSYHDVNDVIAYVCWVAWV